MPLQMANRLGHPDQAVRSGADPDDREQPDLEKPEQKIVLMDKQETQTNYFIALGGSAAQAKAYSGRLASGNVP